MTRSQAPALIAVCALAAVGTTTAQTVPYQSAQRAGAGLVLGRSELPRGGVFEPRVEAAVQYAANIELAADGEPQIDTAGVEVAPGFYASYSSDAILAAIDYSIVGRFWEDSDFDDVAQRLSANGQWIAVPEWFGIRGQATYADAVIDPRDGLNYGGLGIFGTGNLQEVATASVSPILQHRFGNLEVVAEYAYGRTWFLDQGKGQPVTGFVSDEDSTDQSASLSFGTWERGSQISGRVFYDWERSEYETALPFEYERAGVDAGFRISRTLVFVGDLGRESDLDASTTEGGLDSDFWSAGVRWEPSDRTVAEARFGERFFGDSYWFSATHRARLLEFSASYSEQPTVETRQLSLGEFEPGELPPPVPDADFGRLTSSPYVSKDARAGVTAVGSRTRLGLTGFQVERDYLSGLRPDEIGTGVALDATRQLASNLSADFAISYSDYERDIVPLDPDLSGGSSSDYDTVVLLRLNRTAGSHFTVGSEAGYLTRSGAIEYDGWWVALRLRWTP